MNGGWQAFQITCGVVGGVLLPVFVCLVAAAYYAHYKAERACKEYRLKEQERMNLSPINLEFEACPNEQMVTVVATHKDTGRRVWRQSLDLPPWMHRLKHDQSGPFLRP